MSYLNTAARQPATRTLAGKEIPNIGVAEAEHELGLFFSEEVYADKYLREASKWFTKSIEHGNLYSALKLGLIYMNGNDERNGVRKDLARAEKLLLSAYKSGNAVNVISSIG